MGRRDEPLGLVADIGGTNGRFALVCSKQKGAGFDFFEQRHYSCAAFENFAAMADCYLREAGQSNPLRAVIAVAGAVHDNHCAMTLLDWVIDGEQLQREPAFSSVQLLNDFAALAYALPLLQDGDLVLIGAPQQGFKGARLVIGPGTGLGAAFLTSMGSSHLVLEGEGGHISFAPVDQIEVEVLSWLISKYGRVSVERILSGAGLQDLHQALAQVNGQSVERLVAEQIMREGLLSDGAERRTLLRFCAILGSFAGDLALAGGCWSGVYIGGGIAPRMAELLATSQFRARFEQKGRFAAKLRQVPSWLITDNTPALLGAAFCLSEATQ